jgi:hypothetical protein
MAIMLPILLIKNGDRLFKREKSVVIFLKTIMYLFWKKMLQFAGHLPVKI